MEGFNTYEYATEQKSEGKYLAMRILLLIGYVAYCAAYFILIYVTRIFPLGALIPLTLWILIYFTWRYTSPDYKYVIEKGTLTFTVSYGKRTRERLRCEIRISSAEVIQPYADGCLSAYELRHVYSAVPSVKSRDVYFIVFTNASGARCAFTFVATAQALKLLHFLNSKTVLTETER